MRSEFNGAGGPGLGGPQDRLRQRAGPGSAAPPVRPKSRLPRSRFAKPLLTSLGTATLLMGSTFVVVATSSTGSMNPFDWRQANLAGASARFQLCDGQGLGAIGCMLSSGFSSASATTAHARSSRSQPLFAMTTVQDPAPADTPGAKPGSKTAAAGGWTSSAWAKTHLVHLPNNATRADVLKACMTAMKGAVGQGAAAVKEVADECRADYSEYCKPQMRTPTAQGTAAIQEMDDECTIYQQRSSSSQSTPERDD